MVISEFLMWINSPTRKVRALTIDAGGAVEAQWDTESGSAADIYIILACFPCVAILAEACVFINEVHTRASIQTGNGSTVLKIETNKTEQRLDR